MLLCPAPLRNHMAWTRLRPSPHNPLGRSRSQSSRCPRRVSRPSMKCSLVPRIQSCEDTGDQPSPLSRTTLDPFIPLVTFQPASPAPHPTCLTPPRDLSRGLHRFCRNPSPRPPTLNPQPQTLDPAHGLCVTSHKVPFPRPSAPFSNPRSCAGTLRSYISFCSGNIQHSADLFQTCRAKRQESTR